MHKIESFRAENFRMVDIEINAWSSLFLNIETNLILYLYSEKCIKSNQSESHIWNPINLKFCAPFKIYTETGGTLNKKKPVFEFSILYPIRLRRKSKVCPMDTQIK